MGATVSAYWPGIKESDYDLHPGFYNDCQAWGNWMAERLQHKDVIAAMKELGVDALLSHTTDGMKDSEVMWATPEEVEKAAVKLRELVKNNHPKTKRIIETYAMSAAGVDPIEKEFMQDLYDIIAISNYVKNKGVKKFTLSVNW
jgi:hypothetical protein